MVTNNATCKQAGRRQPDNIIVESHQSVLDLCAFFAWLGSMNVINSSQKACNIIQPNIDRFVEELWAIALASTKELISYEKIFRGTSDACLFHPRDIYRFAILNCAAGIIVIHNHPFSSSEPSGADILATRRLIKISKIIGIEFLDHVVLGTDGHFSFRDNGLLRSRLSRIGS